VAGMNAHLTKPIDEMVLYRTLAQLLPPAPVVPPATGAVVDLAATSRRLAGRPERLARLFQGFIRDFAGMPAQIDSEHRAGRLDAVAELAHMAKGSAAYLDAHALCDTAALLEEAARRGDRQAVRQQVPLFSARLEAVLAEVRAQLAGAAREKPAPAAKAGALDAQAVLDLVNRAEPLVACGDYAAEALLAEIGDRLAGTAAAGLADAVATHYGDLDLEAAGAALGRLRADLLHQATGDAPE
jgi:two-component system sensor histidine kinase/response regulator